MEALGEIRVREYYDDVNAPCIVVDYNIDVPETLNNYLFYENYISKENEKNFKYYHSNKI